MNILDLRTVLIGYVLSSTICAAVMVSLFFQNRSRSVGIGLWAFGFIFQSLGNALIAMRGSIPDFVSIVIGNVLSISMVFAIYIGLERFFQRTTSQIINLAVLALYSATQYYFTYAQPDLKARTILFSIVLIFFALQSAWLLLRRVENRQHPITRLVGLVFIFICLFSIARISFDLVKNPGNDLFKSGLPDTLIIFTYQVLSISLTFLLFLLVNRRLVNNLEEDILTRSIMEESLRTSEERFSKAFHSSPDALLISLLKDGTLLEVNESFTRLSGYTVAEALGRTTVDLKIWKSQEDRQSFTRKLQEQRQLRDVEFTFYRKNGQPFQCLVSGETIQIGQDECLLIIVRDITENKKIEQAEKEQRALSEALVNTSRALNSSLKFDEVLDLILDHLGRVVPHDSANIMVLEENGVGLIVRSRGYKEHGQADLTGKKISLVEMPIINLVAIEGRPAAIPNVKAEPLWHSTPEVVWVNSYAVAPIRSRGRTVGFLNLESAKPGFFNAGHAERLQAFADQASIAIENSRLYENVENLAITDPLTGLYNRRGLNQLGDREVARSQRFLHPLAAIMLDIDHFKVVNDTYGHPAGDRVLVALASTLRSHVRNVDLVTRFGGEEFFLLLSETEQSNAESAAERIRQAVENLVVPVALKDNISDSTIQVTVSLGLVMLGQDMANLDALIKATDKALYEAKTAGRNRVFLGKSLKKNT